MRRRDFLAGSAASWVASALAKTDGLGVNSPASSERTTLENQYYRVDVDPVNGLIVRLRDKIGGLELITEPRLADNFRLLVPLPELEGNYILGKQQRLSSLRKRDGGLNLEWAGPLTNDQGGFAISVSMSIELVENRIEFRLQVRNGSENRVAETWYPVLGGVTGVGDRSDTQEIVPFMGGTSETDLFKDFPSMMGIGIPFPECFWSYPFPMPMPWIDISNSKLKRGMYFACHDTICRFKTVRCELHPGADSRQYGGNWPRTDDVGEEVPLGLKIHWTQFPYIKPGESFAGPPVVVQFHEGDWHESAALYRSWFRSSFELKNPRDGWISREMAFQDTMFLLPEGNVLWKFKDIPRWAQSALRHGVKSVLISGWNVGGHDSHYPAYEPDPRLGTWQDLATGIQACHKLGVRVFFFANIQPVDEATDAYKKDLRRFASTDPWGCNYASYGFGMGSLGARLGFTSRPLINVSPGFPEFRQLIVGKMKKLAELGADGVHIDKVWPIVGLDFNPDIPLSPDQATSEGKLRTLDEILRACRAVNPEFCISTESAWDRTLSYANVAWAWHANAKDHVPALKFTFPEWIPGLAAPQPYDFTPVNNAVRYGHQIFLGPGNYTESMDYAPMTRLCSYVEEILRIREMEKDTIFFGEFLDERGIQVEKPEEVRATSFRDPKTGRRACVLVNLAEQPRRAKVVAFANNTNGSVRIHAPFEKLTRARLPASMEIPSQRLAIVAEDM